MSGLVGRERLWTELTAILAETTAGRGGLVLLAGEAGVGKTRLAGDALQQSGLLVLGARAGTATSAAFGPVVGALRAFLRVEPHGLSHADRLGRYLPLLLPELGSPPPDVDRDTLFEAVLAAFVTIARRAPTAVFLDDLQDADHATLDLLTHLAAGLGEVPLLLLGAYRSDELRRGHPLRRRRADLRRAGLLRELVVEPLDADATAELAKQILGRAPSPGLAAMLYQRTDGLPLFVEELLATLLGAGRLEDSGAWRLTGSATSLPVPESVRDLVLLRATTLGADARAAVEVAAVAVAGVGFDLELVDALLGREDALGEAFAAGFLVESAPGTAAFRHGLIRDAFYHEIPWPRRRALHRQVAEFLERQGAAPSLLAEHWFAGREHERARQALLVAVEQSCRVHAYRDAAAWAERALELWPEGELESARLATLDRLAQSAQLSGDLASAAAAWREVAEAHARTAELRRLAEAQRRLAGVYELQGTWEQARLARAAAAEGFARCGQPGEAAAERLAAAVHLRSAAEYPAALEVLEVAAREARTAGRVDLQARVLGLEGNVQARLGQYEAGVRQVRDGLALALERNYGAAAAEVYQRLADALEHSGDYRSARRVYLDAAAFCDTRGADATAQLCRACMTVVLRQTGDWDQCVRVCSEVLASENATLHARTVALGMHGLVRAQRGEAARARPLLLESNRQAAHIELAAIELLSLWGLSVVEEVEGHVDAALTYCVRLYERWSTTAERHYAIPALRWATSLFAERGAAAQARACANALAQIVAETGAAEAVAGLGHALGELSLLDGDVEQAARHFVEALECLGRLDLPHEHAHTRLRAGLTLVSSGDREQGVQHLVDSYRSAKALGARPLAATAARALERLGEPIDRRLGRRAAGLLERGGLTRRELEVLRLVADGCTDREIASTLVVSPRTVEMHVGNALGKLGCRSRAEAVGRAVELQLLAHSYRSQPLKTP